MSYPAPAAPALTTAAFDLHGPDQPISPVIIAVSHAGRDYGADLLAAARVGPDVLRRLEDRYVDLLAHPLIDLGYTVLVARAPRAMIDLNRDEREIDPAMIAGMPRDTPLQSSAKLRGGLGLLPRRLPGAAELWQRPIAWAEAVRRIETIHRPYHAALEEQMRRAWLAHGHAVLIDLHSMPPLPPVGAGAPAPGVVLGDRFGRAASARLMSLADDVLSGHGVRVAQNHPYAGDHSVERHGRPARDRHAMQVEVDRSLYLDEALERPGPGLARTQAAIVSLVNAIASESPRAAYPMAAE